MSSIKQYIFGVRISLSLDTDYSPTLVPVDNIGLYAYVSSGNNMYFGWTQTALAHPPTGYSYKAGILVSLGKVGNAAVFRNGGNTAQIPTTEIKILSTDLIASQGLWKTLKTLGISLIGKKIEIIEFDASTNPATPTILFTGSISESTTFDEETYTLTCENNYYKRKANLATVIDNSTQNGAYPNAPDSTNGKIIPISLGNINKSQLINGFKLNSTYKEVLNGIEIDTFPVIGNDPTNRRQIDVLFPVNNVNLGALRIATHLQVISGTNEGEIKIIDSSTPINTGGNNNTQNRIVVRDYYSAQMIFSADGKTANQSWVRLLNLGSIYYSDTWCCKGYLDESNNSTTKPQLYTYDSRQAVKTENNLLSNPPIVLSQDKNFINLPSDFGAINTDKSITILPKQLSGINNFTDFTVLPIKNFRFIDYGASVNLKTYWELESETFLNSYYYKLDTGFYATAGTGSYHTTASLLNVSSQNYNSAPLNIIATYNATNPTLILGFDFPVLDESFQFDNMYLAVNIVETQNNNNGTYYAARMRNFTGYATAIKLGQGTNPEVLISNNNANYYMDDVPDFYYTLNTPTSNGNKNFYLTLDPTGLYNYLLSGYKNFPIDNIYVNNGKSSIYQSAIFIKMRDGNYSNTYSIKSIAVIYSKNISIQDTLYSNFSGRTFWKTSFRPPESPLCWNDRRLKVNLIQNNLDTLEHILRLQNWQETDPTGSVNPGKAYGTNPLIKCGSPTTEGDFDYTFLTPYKENIARQILDFNDADTDTLAKSLCQQFFLCNYKDNLGYECINTVQPLSNTSNVTLQSVTYSDVLDGSVGEITEQHVSDIFCEPVIYYDYNSATQKYDSCIQVTNSGYVSYQTGFVTGLPSSSINESTAQKLWNLSHALWKNYGVINTPPDFLTHCDWIRTQPSDITANQAPQAAIDYLNNWFQWMGVYKTSDSADIIFSPKRWITFSVGYDFAWIAGSPKAPWFPSMHFNLNLPYETGGTNVQCIIEKIDYDIDNGKADITAIMLDINNIIDTYIQDSYTSYAPVWADWQDSYYTQVQQPSQSYDIQEIY
jgi:hypothetical protein